MKGKYEPKMNEDGVEIEEDIDDDEDDEDLENATNGDESSERTKLKNYRPTIKNK